MNIRRGGERHINNNLSNFYSRILFFVIAIAQWNMKVISSSFPFNKTSVHFISERRLNLNYFDFSWPNFGKCYQTWKRRLFWASPVEIKRHSLHFCVSLWIFLSCISSECRMHIILKSLLRLLTRPFAEKENLQRKPSWVSLIHLTANLFPSGRRK